MTRWPAPLSPDEVSSIQAFARFFDARRATIVTRMREALAESPTWSRVIDPFGTQPGALHDEESTELQMRAIFHGQWQPYLASLRTRGEQYARAGVAYSAWFELLRAYRDVLAEELASYLAGDPGRDLHALATITRGMNALVDLAIEQIGEAYLDPKQRELARKEPHLGANLDHGPVSPSELRAPIISAHGGKIEPSTTSAPSPEPRYRVLIVDDDDQLRHTVVRLLQRAEFEAVDASSGEKAIAALSAATFDVVVSDVNMPDGGGLELLRAVRRVDLDVPVILMTGEPSIEAASAAVEYGAFRYLTKPFDSSAFITTVKHAARAHALARIRRQAYSVSGAHAGVTDRAGLEVRFEEALAGLRLVFQPIVHAASGALFGVEALMRSSEPSLPHPGAVLDAAAQLGRLPIVGRKVRSLSSAALAPRRDEIALFVNLHPEDLQDVDLVRPESPLSQIAPRVVLEITERASLESSPQLTDRIARLRQLGFRLAVDDIGAGYSGLSSFTELTPEVVKIDMSLVRDVHKSALKQRTIAALCRLCHDSGALVVGEGVETVEERDTLVGLGCDLLQGYLIGRPQPSLP
jgi:EAL domain-containing protein (putative c-di-GMP-specific phosphodiesterase class I)